MAISTLEQALSAVSTCREELNQYVRQANETAETLRQAIATVAQCKDRLDKAWRDALQHCNAITAPDEDVIIHPTLAAAFKELEIDHVLSKAERAAADRGNQIEAVKLVRERLALPLPEAKALVDAYRLGT